MSSHFPSNSQKPDFHAHSKVRVGKGGIGSQPYGHWRSEAKCKCKPGRNDLQQKVVTGSERTEIRRVLSLKPKYTLVSKYLHS